jgi:hypothetical protein
MKPDLVNILARQAWHWNENSEPAHGLVSPERLQKNSSPIAD